MLCHPFLQALSIFSNYNGKNLLLRQMPANLNAWVCYLFLLNTDSDNFLFAMWTMFLFQVAKRAAILYFVLADLSQIDVMYQFSLPWYANIFQRSIDSSQTAVSVNDTFSSHDGMASMSNFSDDRADDEGENLSALLNSMSNRYVNVSCFSKQVFFFKIPGKLPQV